MSGKTISEKILSTKAGLGARANDLVVCSIDFALGTDASMPMTIDYFEKMGGGQIFDSRAVVISLDHYAPAANSKTANLHTLTREFAKRNRIRLFEVGSGIGHQLVVENGLVKPGDLAIGADSHAVTYGAFNAFATGVGSSDLAAALISGQIWLKVPETVRVFLEGELPNGVYPKDLVLALLDKMGADGATYRSLEFQGPGAMSLEVEERLVLSNMSTEMGAKNGIFPFDQKTDDFLSTRPSGDFEPVHADADAEYSAEVSLNLSSLEPLIALPHRVDTIAPLKEVAGTPIDMVFLGTCTAGQVRDYQQAHAGSDSGRWSRSERSTRHHAFFAQSASGAYERRHDGRLSQHGRCSHHAGLRSLLRNLGSDSTRRCQRPLLC